MPKQKTVDKGKCLDICFDFFAIKFFAPPHSQLCSYSTEYTDAHTLGLSLCFPSVQWYIIATVITDTIIVTITPDKKLATPAAYTGLEESVGGRDGERGEGM